MMIWSLFLPVPTVGYSSGDCKTRKFTNRSTTVEALSIPWFSDDRFVEAYVNCCDLLLMHERSSPDASQRQASVCSINRNPGVKFTLIIFCLDVQPPRYAHLMSIHHLNRPITIEFSWWSLSRGVVSRAVPLTAEPRKRVLIALECTTVGKTRHFEHSDTFDWTWQVLFLLFWSHQYGWASSDMINPKASTVVFYNASKPSNVGMIMRRTKNP